MVLVVALLALGAGVVVAGTGILGRTAGGLGAALGGLIGGLTSAPPSASPTMALITAPPRLTTPDNAYTSQPTWDVRGFLPNGVAGRRGYAVRIYLNGEFVRQEPVPATADFLVAGIPIPRGRSAISATIGGPGGESAPSAPISVVFDDVPPKLVIKTPKDGQTVNAATVLVTGETQAGSTVMVRNESTAAAATTLAAQGTFELELGLGKGSNGLTVTATDPAGNVRSVVVSVVKGDGRVTASLSLSGVRFALSSLPKTMTMRVLVLDPDGRRVDGAKVTFSISPPGLPTETFDATTVNGEATWPGYLLPRDGATKGSGFVTVLVTMPDGLVLQDSQGFSIV
ncbi:MAG TPA: Ig-like domain-containing protein [Candidatus Limnocylindrales bacterium]|nr:Ig-like domain-containing protein [Candidatus Limnocylindrales bacterium]